MKNEQSAMNNSEQLLLFVEQGDGLASGETGLGLVPMGDGFLVGFPTEQNFAALVHCGEIEECAGGVFQFDADDVEFVDQFFEAIGGAFKIFLEGLLPGGGYSGEAGTEFRVNLEALCLGRLNITSHAFDEGEGPFCFRERKVLTAAFVTFG